ALMTAAWLIQMGLSNVHVLAAADAATSLVTGPEAIETPPPPAADTLTPEDLNAALTAGAVTVVDLQPSLAYREGHIPGAWFLVRARWQADLAALGAAAGKLVVTSPDGALALWAAAEMTAAGRPASALAGGTEAWAAAEYPLTQGMENPASLTDDVFLLPYARRDPDEAAAAMNAYLTWEVALLDQIKKPGGISFPQF
ncbi:MAG: rhodanese-like domain-containing protein, partial [Pseudomonadota bacterium]|nr:rhodanese-like domain-containing protein [Pseudomonadota bacterium]